MSLHGNAPRPLDREQPIACSPQRRHLEINCRHLIKTLAEFSPEPVTIIPAYSELHLELAKLF
jgi:hypothetical protein